MEEQHNISPYHITTNRNSTNEISSFFIVSHFSYLTYILLGSPLYNKKELWDTHNKRVERGTTKKLPMDYNNVNRWYNIGIKP